MAALPALPPSERGAWSVSLDRVREAILTMAGKRAPAVAALYYLTGARLNELVRVPPRPSHRELTAAVGPTLGDVEITTWNGVEVMVIPIRTLKRKDYVTRVVPVVLDPRYEPLGPIVKEYYLVRLKRAHERVEWLRARIPRRELAHHPELNTTGYPLLSRLVPNPWRHEHARRNEPYYAGLSESEVYYIISALARYLGAPPRRYANPLRHLRATHLVRYYHFLPEELDTFMGWTHGGMRDRYVSLDYTSFLPKLLVPARPPDTATEAGGGDQGSSPSPSPSSS